jgi:hypothetical protein
MPPPPNRGPSGPSQGDTVFLTELQARLDRITLDLSSVGADPADPPAQLRPRPQNVSLPIPRWLRPWHHSARGLFNPYGDAPPLPAPRYNYYITSRHYPVQWQSDKMWRDSPWSAEFVIATNGLEQALAQDLPWRENHNCCYSDEITVCNDSQLPGQKTYRRELHWVCIRGTTGPPDWDVTVRVFSKDARWLADFPRVGLGYLISIETAVR